MREELTEEYIREVWERLPKTVRPTTFQSTHLLNRALGVETVIASETLQVTGSFKFRAAYNLLSAVPNEEIVTVSSGNFGQALTYACKLLGKQATVLMPTTSSRTKQAAIQSYGGRVELIDVTNVSRAKIAADYMERHPGAFYAPPYDHYRVVAGNSTLGKEIFEALVLGRKPEERIEAVVCPIGGGGLISGIIVARDLLAPDVEVIGAEPLLGNDAAQSLREGRMVTLEREPLTIADGTRTLSVGKLNWEIIREGVKRIIEVPEEKIAEGVRALFAYANLKAEPTGALSVGAMLTQPEIFAGKHICCVVSGGNVDVETYLDVMRDA
jgi:threonine dehydratase